MGTLVLNGATSGSTTLQPTDATTQTITFPSGTGTVITTASIGKVIPTAALPAGTVLQVVNSSYNTTQTTTSASYSNTGLAASITPTSATSKILVMITHSGCSVAPGNGQLGLQLLRGASILVTWESGLLYMAGLNNDRSCDSVINYYDSPATTSNITYSTQFSAANSVTSYVQRSATSTMTLVEIAA